MTRTATQRPIHTRLHDLVESYTPDGTRGRVGLAAVAGPVGVYAFMLAFGFLVNPWIGSLVVVPGAAVAGVLLTALAVLMLWPVYPSAIGRIDSPAAYPDGSSDGLEPSPEERLKRQYERGQLSEAELERELEAILEESRHEDTETGQSTSSVRTKETERAG